MQNDSITFGDLGISIDLLKILKNQNLINPTPIQAKCISIGLEGKDIVGIAQTGTGKTLAFGLPVIEQIRKNKSQCLIMLPTRELAIQVNQVLSDLGRRFRINTALLIGGVSSRSQKIALRKNPSIIIATPGRMIDHLHQKNVSLRNISIVVLDEADRMLDIGFMPQIKEVLKSVPEQRQTMLFSATMPTEISNLSEKYMNNPIRIEVSPAGTSAKNVKQEAYIVSASNKLDLLEKTIKENSGSILVFTRTKHKAKKVSRALRCKGFTAIEMHSDRSLAQRKNALNGFKSGKFKVLVATDVASRGLDINDISIVINFDLPDCSEDYVHRVGRTGRAGKNGKAISFIEPDEKFKLLSVEKVIKKSITINSGPEKFINDRKGNRNKHSGRPQWKSAKTSKKNKRSNTNSWKRSGHKRPGRRKKRS